MFKKILDWLNTFKWFLLIIAILCILLWIFVAGYSNQKHEKIIWKNNTESALSEIVTYKINDSIQAVKISGLVMSLHDVEVMNKQLIDQIKRLNVKNKELSALIAIQQEQLLKNPDTIYVEITPPTDSTHRLLDVTYKDEWIDANIRIDDFEEKAIIKPENFKYQSKDSIYCAPTIKWKGCWFWKRAVGVELQMFNTNPHTKIVGGQYIELKKPKKAKKLTD